MFWVTMAGILPLLYSEASARWPRPGRAAAKVGSIAKRRRHASSRASWLATNSSNGIGRLRVHNPPGERKSGIPHSVEIPAPVIARSVGLLRHCPRVISQAIGQVIGERRHLVPNFGRKFWSQVLVASQAASATGSVTWRL